jgi:hypothetical protein
MRRPFVSTIHTNCVPKGSNDGDVPNLQDSVIVSHNNGNVGIGVGGPLQKLTVAGGVAATGARNASGETGVYLYDDGTSGNVAAWAGNSHRPLQVTGEHIDFWAGNAYDEKMRINTDGNVGIGLPNPGEKLEVNGNIKIPIGTGTGTPPSARIFTTQKVFNVLDYEADNTGLNDSKTKIQNAINDAAANGGIVFLPAGIYKISNKLSLPNRVYLIGDGPRATQLNLDNATASIAVEILINISAYEPCESSSLVRNLRITTLNTNIHIGIYMKAFNVAIENVEVDGMDIGLQIIWDCNVFRDLKVHNCKTGVQLGDNDPWKWANGNTFIGGSIIKCTVYGMHFTDATYGNSVHGMFIALLRGFNAEAGIYIEGDLYGDNLITGCFIETCSKYCIKLNSPGNHIIGNWFHVKPGAGFALYFQNGGKTQDDLTPGSSYSGTGFKNYRVEIQTTIGLTDTFRWSDDGGNNWNGSGINCSTTDFALNNNVTIKFGAVTGHNMGDKWDWIVGNQYVDWGSYKGTVYIGNTEYTFNTSGVFDFKERFLSNVGIGTTSPGSPLHIVGSNDIETPTVPSLLSLSDSSDPTKALRLGYDDTLDRGVIAASDYGTGWKDIVIAPYGGNVGIGITNPGATLEVASAASQYACIAIDYFGTQRSPRLDFNTSAGNSIGSIVRTTDGQVLGQIVWVGVDSSNLYSTSGRIQFLQEGNAGSCVPSSIAILTATASLGPIERMRIRYDGNVGIGETSPARKLHVKDSNKQVARIESTAVSNLKVDVCVNNGTPNAVITALRGSLCVDITNAKLYINNSGTNPGDSGTSWVLV